MCKNSRQERKTGEMENAERRKRGRGELRLERSMSRCLSFIRCYRDIQMRSSASLPHVPHPLSNPLFFPSAPEIAIKVNFTHDLLSREINVFSTHRWILKKGNLPYPERQWKSSRGLTVLTQKLSQNQKGTRVVPKTCEIQDPYIPIRPWP